MALAQSQPTRAYDFQSGTNAVADNVDTDLNTLYTVLQGGVGNTHIASDAAIDQNKLATTTLGYTAVTADFTTTTTSSDVDVTNLTVTVTVPSGGRRVKITAWAESIRTSAASGTGINWSIKESTTVLTSMVISATQNYKSPCIAIYSVVASAGSHTYKVAVQQSAAGTLTQAASSTAPAFIMVEII